MILCYLYENNLSISLNLKPKMTYFLKMKLTNFVSTALDFFDTNRDTLRFISQSYF